MGVGGAGVVAGGAQLTAGLPYSATTHAPRAQMSSRYLAHFEAEVTAWQRALAAISDVVTQLAEIQRKWAYLEALFIGSDEVRRELPDDAARFEGIDVAVRAILAEAWATRNVRDACGKPGLLAALEGLTAGLDACEKALADFLDAKRRCFPRFYFMSTADLLDLLSNGSTPARILAHVPKVLLATESLQLEAATPGAPGGGGGRPTAVSWSSCVGVERVAFNPPVRLEGKVEAYMQTVLDAQRDALRRALHDSLARRATQGRVEWIMDKSGGSGGAATDPAQITLLVSGMDYVAAVEAAFDAMAGSPGTPGGKAGKGGKGGRPAVAPDRGAMQAALDRAVADLNDLIRLTQSSLSKGDRTRVMCLITLDAHGRDVIQKLIAEGVTSKDAFQWQSQLKQRYAGDGRAVLAIADARFDYQFGECGRLRAACGEGPVMLRSAHAITPTLRLPPLSPLLPPPAEYLGNGPRLVVTPLTDRIYVTATQALNLRMGCAPAGPAGTGKTETTKDLSAALALPCYVSAASGRTRVRRVGGGRVSRRAACRARSTYVPLVG
jgi:dynein heavy chain, axonemal